MNVLVRALLLLMLSGTALADEGMWTFDNFPKQLVKEKLGVDITDAWLDHARLATTRLESGCTGSFISPDGLILTNHHCASECLAQISTPQKDMLADGFLAASRSQEPACKTEQISVLVAMEDITAQDQRSDPRTRRQRGERSAQEGTDAARTGLRGSIEEGQAHRSPLLRIGFALPGRSVLPLQVQAL